jgi:formate-dependent nitrite reductase membrane component NrfD
MIELTTTRANHLIDPHLHVWSWEIPAYLFLGGIVAGLMVLGGLNLWRWGSGRRDDVAWPVQTPLLAFVLLNLGMGALFLDLEHKLYVWAVYLTFQPTAPMSWGSWVLILVFPVLLASALVRLPEAWPWLGDRFPALRPLSERMLANSSTLRLLGGLNIGLGIMLGIYTGVLLSTMVSRPLWNSAILGPLFLVSGLSAAAALMHLLSHRLGTPAPRTMIGGALSALAGQALSPSAPSHGGSDSLSRADIAFLAVELALIVLLIIGLGTAGASHAAAAALLTTGRYAAVFWVGVVAIGILIPLYLQFAELGGRAQRTAIPALLVLVGGITLRWVMVSAGQFSHVLTVAGN